MMDVNKVLSKHEKFLLKHKNVTDIGIGEEDGTEFIIVFVSEKLPESELKPEDIVPKNLDGVRIKVESEIKIG